MRFAKKYLICRPLVLTIVCWFSMIIVSPTIASAGLSLSKGSDNFQNSVSTRDENINKIKTVLETKVVIQKLEDFGLSADEAKKRISEMSDEQVHQMASLSDRILAGGSDLGIVVAVLVIILLVVILIKIMGRDIVIR